jgi:hypothetical protein
MLQLFLFRKTKGIPIITFSKKERNERQKEKEIIIAYDTSRSV